MNRVARKGLVTAMVAGGVLASAGYAQADSAAEGGSAGSPGVLSGNTVQAPVDIPLNVCGNTINVIGLLNPALGNSCANTSHSTASSRPRGARTAAAARPARHPAASSLVDPGGPRKGSSLLSAGPLAARDTGDGAHALAESGGSPGVLAGNSLGLPIHLPVNVSGNSVNVVGIGNPAFGNTAVNGGVHTPPPPPAHQPVPAPPNEAPDPVPGKTTPAAESHQPALAHTGSDGMGWTAAGGAALLLGGAVLFRRSRRKAS
ncbi:chaplin [Streptomyces polygonati]|uniref:Chaplin n=1 Tax=Streptomyces polygonati TaxID=1617087 RepID=A0ABV8HLJ7_9ACTN